MRLLDPTNDYVFKILFKDPGDEPRLIAMLTAILEPTQPITSVTVLNPEIPADLATVKTIVLDLRLGLADGSTIDVEMESSPTRTFGNRLVFYWSRAHSQQLAKGEGYEKLRPTISIAWTAGVLPHPLRAATDPTKMHSRFRIRNVETNADLTDHLEIHLLELPKREADATLSPALRRWARFFDHPSEADLAELAAEDEIMADTVKKLWTISEDERNFYLAESRRKGEIRYQLDVTDAFEQGRIDVARAMLDEGIDRSVVARVLGVPETALEALLADFDGDPSAR